MPQFIWLYVIWKCTIWSKRIPDNMVFNLIDDDSIDILSGSEEEEVPEVPDVQASDVSKGVLGWGVRIGYGPYVGSELRKALGLLTFSEISSGFPLMSVNKLNLYKEGAQIGAFRSFNIVLEALDKNKLYPLFGQIHKTYLICSSSTTKDEIIGYLAANDIKVGEENAQYKAVLDSFSWRRINTKV